MDFYWLLNHHSLKTITWIIIHQSLNPYLLTLFLCSDYVITRFISTVKRWVLIFLWRFCERYEPCKIVKITPCKFTCKGVYFCYFIGRQPYSEGSLSRAVHGVCHYFTEIFHLLSHRFFLVWPHFYNSGSFLHHDTKIPPIVSFGWYFV